MTFIRPTFFFLLFIAGGFWVNNTYVVVKTKPLIFHDLEKIPKTNNVLVLGASVYRSGKLSATLSQRMATAVHYIHFHQSRNLIVSGHSIPGGYNEPRAMAEYALLRLNNRPNILLDAKGTSTYMSMVNYSKQHKNQPVVIITQKYHLPRSLYIARSLGIHAYGLIAPNPGIGRFENFNTREVFSRIKDFWLILFLKLFQV